MKLCRYLVVGLLLSSGLVGCAGVPPAEQLRREMAGVDNSSPVFSQGYADGCQSGLSAGGDGRFVYVKDLSKVNQPNYKLGWEDGFRICQSRQVQRNNERNSTDRFGGAPYPWFPRTGVSIGVQL
ncbi:hypothetical protein [Candidatus Thiothrix anitrata]|jgi:hypothetical protein|uniref:Lipoprotein n=1 Tax=Candidatus Thiothrix anitrata TaxID=2823902 RepID=A0ABX7WZ55_9GAMM|nr:hypothetical protein [Candidatus Thiothrix anitrata]QTR48907.1 hypothetical protein J8380_11520 [Candidatus Thiothrix anitrata]